MCEASERERETEALRGRVAEETSINVARLLPAHLERFRSAAEPSPPPPPSYTPTHTHTHTYTHTHTHVKKKARGNGFFFLRYG